MDRADIVERLAKSIAGAERHPLGIAGLMIESEVAAGRKPVQPGATVPFDFPADDWVSPAVVSIDGDEVRIIAILAQRIGGGSFRRLIDNIIAAGLRPVVVEPVGTIMPAIMKRWGWRGRRVGGGWESCVEFRPPRAA